MNKEIPLIERAVLAADDALKPDRSDECYDRAVKLVKAAMIELGWVSVDALPPEELKELLENSGFSTTKINVN